MKTPFAFKIGHATDARLKSGTTVILPDRPAIAAVHTAGGCPGTRETDLLAPENSVDRIDAITLSGGSAFGLAAADGAAAWLAREGRGFNARGHIIPIVPAAIIFDLVNGGDKTALPGPHNPTGGDPLANPYRDLGIKAAQNAGREFAVGSIGVGAGATTQNLKGGFGAAIANLPGGGHIAAIAAVNPSGRVTFGDGPHFRAAACEQDGEFGALGFPESVTPDMAEPLVKSDAERNTNTTLGVIVTDIPLTKAQLKRVAIAAHDGLAIAIYPVHTPFDGDIVFALSTAENHPATPTADPVHQLKDIGAIATTTLARAIAMGVYKATAEPGDVLPTWQDRFACVTKA